MNRFDKQRPPEQKQQILQAIAHDIDLPAVSYTYLAGLLFTACAVLMLPLLYLGVLLLSLGGLILFIRTANYVAALLMLSLILGLIKPFFAKSSAVKRSRTLRRDAEPFLYEYIDCLCDAVGARRPTNIHVTCDLNAAAEFRRGWLSVLSGRGISLHLGLPLVAGLTLRQFTGVLSHELGHFTQRTAMWLENTVRQTNRWFLRAAYERDSIDDWLARRSLMGFPASIPCLFARLVIWVTHWIWLGLAQAGTIMSCLMSREMEFNADRCEVRTVGSETFESTIWRMRELSLAHQISFRDVVAFFNEGRLPDNMIALTVANTAYITPKVKRKLRQLMNEEKTRLFDTHPCDQDRIQLAKADGSPGFVQQGSQAVDLPASVLFTRFDEVSKAVTNQFYIDSFGQSINPRLLHPVENLLNRQSVEIDASRALRRYFQTRIPPLRPLPIAPQSTVTPENPREAALELKACRERMIVELPEYKRLTPRYQSAEEIFFETIAAQTLLQASVKFNPVEYHLPEASADAIVAKHAKAREGVSNLAVKLLPFETEAGNRLSFAMQLFQVPAVVRKIPNGDDLQYEIQSLLPEAQYVSRLVGELPTLRIIFTKLSALWERTNGNLKSQQVHQLVSEQIATLRSRLTSIQTTMGEHLYPFDHAEADATLRAYALPEIPSENDLGGLVQVTEQMQSRLITIQMRLFARLAQAAERIEEVIGLPPLPESVDDFEE